MASARASRFFCTAGRIFFQKKKSKIRKQTVAQTRSGIAGMSGFSVAAAATTSAGSITS
jgi:hypothetical protein